jgi:anti-anti-sigma regulatory factor
MVFPEGENKMELSYETIQGILPITVLHVAGRIDGSTYLKLIDKAKELMASGTQYLLLDMEACDFLSSAGIFALHSIALIAHQLAPLDPEQGWGALRQLANEVRDLKANFKLVHVHPNVLHTLDVAGFSPFLDIYTDMQAALAAFKPAA